MNRDWSTAFILAASENKGLLKVAIMAFASNPQTRWLLTCMLTMINSLVFAWWPHHHVRWYLWKTQSLYLTFFCPSRSWWCRRGQWRILFSLGGWGEHPLQDCYKSTQKRAPPSILSCPFSITGIPLPQQKWPFMWEATTSRLIS